MTTILIADDDADVRQVLRRCLRDVPCTIVEAADGLEAWALLQQHQPQLVILDIRIPGRNGLELTRAVKADPLLARTWVLIVAGDPQAQAAVQAAGADDFLSKPFVPDALRACVRRGLGQP
jgi:CheY-like chemotaxis protein